MILFVLCSILFYDVWMSVYVFSSMCSSFSLVFFNVLFVCLFNFLDLFCFFADFDVCSICMSIVFDFVGDCFDFGVGLY